MGSFYFFLANFNTLSEQAEAVKVVWNEFGEFKLNYVEGGGVEKGSGG